MYQVGQQHLLESGILSRGPNDNKSAPKTNPRNQTVKNEQQDAAADANIEENKQ